MNDFVNDFKKLTNGDLKNGFCDFLEKIINHINYFNLYRNLDQYKIRDVISKLFDNLKNVESFCIISTLTFRCKKHLPQGEKIKNIIELL